MSSMWLLLCEENITWRKFVRRYGVCVEKFSRYEVSRNGVVRVFQDSQKGRLINVWSQSLENVSNIVEIFTQLFKISDAVITNMA